MRLKNLDLIVAVIIAALNMVWVLVPSRTPVIGTILALPLVFVLPWFRHSLSDDRKILNAGA